MDTVKTRMQGQMTLVSAKPKYNGILSTFRTIHADEGFRGLYGGFIAAVLGSVASTTVYFSSYESLKRWMIDERGISLEVSSFIAGGVGDVVASFVYVPSEVVKTRLQLQGRFNNPYSSSSYNYRGTYHALKSIYETRKLRGMYDGWGATLIRDVPFTAIQFTIYEGVKNWIVKRYCNGDETQMTTAQGALTGATAGVVAGAVTTPLDVAKTYLQTQKRAPTRTVRPTWQDSHPTPPSSTPSSSTASPNKPKPKVGPPPALHPKAAAPFYNGVWSALKGLYAREGVQGLFSGILPRTLWTGCQSVILFVLYEKFLSLSRASREETWSGVGIS
ncbi:hypothetical protein HDV00_003707 [Rhizophlyctis rosea]|nr:hypothetical protein HDV00_003707 [Rhizophlyctis rosea]